MSTLAVDAITNATGTSAMSIDSSGNITASSYIRQTSPIAFSAKSNSGNISVNGVFPFSVENFDIGGNYDPSLYRFVAPVSGVYHFDVSIHSSTGHASPVWLRINGANHFRSYQHIFELYQRAIRRKDFKGKYSLSPKLGLLNIIWRI